MLITFFPRLWHGICAAFNPGAPGQSTQRTAGIGGKAKANGTSFNAAQPKVPAGRAPFLHGEDAEWRKKGLPDGGTSDSPLFALVRDYPVRAEVMLPDSAMGIKRIRLWRGKSRMVAGNACRRKSL